MKKNGRRWLCFLLVFLLVLGTVPVGFARAEEGADSANQGEGALQNMMPVCGKEEHVHTEECYELRLAEGQDAEPVLVCEKIESEGHVHEESCYQTVQKQICGQEESEGHSHDDSCYGVQSELSCDKTEHSHDDGCYDENGDLACETEEHSHDDSCYAEKTVLICGKDESAGHTHEDGCYEETRELICTLSGEAHHHTDECYAAETKSAEQVLVCEKEVHQHTQDCYQTVAPAAGAETAEGAETVEAAPTVSEPEAPEVIYYCGHEADAHAEECFDENGNAVCGNELHTHTHTEECLTEPATPLPEEPTVSGVKYYCGHEADAHTEECFDESGVLICTNEAHTHIHTEECLTEPVQEPEEAEEGSWQIRPEGSLTTAKVAENSYTVTVRSAVNVKFYNEEGEEIEPGEEQSAQKPQGSAAFLIGLTGSEPEGLTGGGLAIKASDGENEIDLTLNLVEEDGQKYLAYEQPYDTDYSFILTMAEEEPETGYTLGIQLYVRNSDSGAEGGEKLSRLAETSMSFSAAVKEPEAIEGEWKVEPEGTLTAKKEEENHYLIAVSSESKVKFVSVEDGKEIDPSKEQEEEKPEGIIEYLISADSVRGKDLGQYIEDNGLSVEAMIDGEKKELPLSLMNVNGKEYLVYELAYGSECGFDLMIADEESEVDYTVKFTLYARKKAIVSQTSRQRAVMRIASAEEEDDSLTQLSVTSADISAQGDEVEKFADLTSYLTAVSGVGTVYIPESGDEPGYFETDLRLDFGISKDVVNAAGLKFHYDFPQDLVVPKNLLNGHHNGYDTNGKLGFIYDFVQNENGTYGVQIYFDADYVESAGEAINGFISFGGFLKESAQKDDGNLSIQFKDGLTLEIPPEKIEFPEDETVNYNLLVKKSGSYINADNELQYTVTVASSKGTPDPITLTDALEYTGLDVTEIAVSSVQKKTGVTIDQYGNIWGGGNEQEVTDYLFNEGENSTSFEMSLPALGENELYTITYKYKLGELKDNVSISGKNKVKVQAKDDDTGENVTDEAEAQVTVTKETLKKTGSFDANTGKANWTIHVNNSGSDIAGAVLTDTMFAETSEEDLTISPSNGYEIQKDEEDKITGIKFVAVADGKNTQTYEIKYKTMPDVIWNSTEVKNTAIFDPDPGEEGDESEVTGKVSVPGSGGVRKEFVSAEAAEDGNVIELTWKTTISIPEGGLEEGIVITDVLGNSWDDMPTRSTRWMTKAQITEWVESNSGWLSEATEKKFLPTDADASNSENWVDYSQLSEEGKYDRFMIIFGNGLSAENFGGNEISFTYKSYVDVSSADNVSYHKNAIDVGGKTSDDTYTHRKNKVVKTDGNGQAGTTSVTTQDGTVTWKVEVGLDKDYESLKITDTLPDNVVLEKLTCGGQYNQTEAIVSEDGNISASLDRLNISGTYQNNVIELNVGLSGTERPDNFKSGGVFYVTYICKLKEELMPSEGVTEATISGLTNRVTVTTEEGEYGSADQTQDITVKVPEEEVKELSKSGVWNNNDRRLNYSLDLNPSAKDLLTNGDMLTLTDELSYDKRSMDYNRYVSLIQSSVKLYYAQLDENGDPLKDETGRLIKGELLPISDWKWDYDVVENGDAIKNVIVATVPDSRALILEYSYLVQMTIPTGWDQNPLAISNVATLSGDNDSSDRVDNNSDRWEESQTSGGISTDKNYTFYKVDSDDFGYALSGAEFTLFGYNSETQKYEQTEKVYETVDGQFMIYGQRADHPEDYAFIPNTAYYVVETKAPDGYELPGSPTKYYFHFSNEDEDTYARAYPDDFPENAIDLSKTSHTEYCENTKNTTEITVEKKWRNADGEEIEKTDGSIEIELYQMTGDDGGSGGAIDEGITFDINITRNGSPWYTDRQSFVKEGCTVTLTLVNDYGEWATEEYYSVQVNGNKITPQITGEGYKRTFTYTIPITGNTSVTGSVKWSSAEDWSSCKITGLEYEQTSSGDDENSPIEEKGELYHTYTIKPGENGEWNLTISDLPKSDSSGTKYLYYVKEVSMSGYHTVYTNNGGIGSGTITITNIKTETGDEPIRLPNTGGPGTLPIVMSELVLAVAAAFIWAQNNAKQSRYTRKGGKKKWVNFH